MKVIDLLNKIANGEEVPKKVYVGSYYFEYEDNGEYINTENSNDLLFDFDSYYPLETCLNQEVEIIEEDKKIESLYMCLNATQEDQMCSEYDEHNFEDVVKHNFKAIHKKINEIIDKLNSMEE